MPDGPPGRSPARPCAARSRSTASRSTRSPRVTSVDGSNVKYDITTEARPIAKDLLARKITEQVAQQARLPVNSATCDDDLQPMVNATTSCTLVTESAPMNVTVTVTKVSGGLIRYSIKRA